MWQNVCWVVCLVCCLVFAAKAATSDVTLGPLAEKGPDDVPALVKALKAGEMGARWNAALILGEIGDKTAVPALQAALAAARAAEPSRYKNRRIQAVQAAIKSIETGKDGK